MNAVNMNGIELYKAVLVNVTSTGQNQNRGKTLP